MLRAKSKKILVVEDELHIAEGIRLNLDREGFEVLVVTDGLAAVSCWEGFSPDLVVLDLMLPGLNGYAVLQHIRLQNERIPILILSAKSDDEHKIRGFREGVDDYLTKPFNLEEFLLRVKRLLTTSAWQTGSESREGGSLVPTPYVFGNNRIDFETWTADCRLGRVSLTDQETKLLKCFIANRGKPLSRRRLLEVGWGCPGTLDTRTVDNFMVRFRRYFEDDPKKPLYFKSLRKVGYVFCDPSEP